MKIHSLILTSIVLITSTFSQAQCPTDLNDFIDGGSFSGACALSVGSAVTVTGSVVWNSDTLQIMDSPGNLIIANGGSLTINGGAIEVFDDGPDGDLINDGRISVNQGGTLIVNLGASISSYAFMTVNGNMMIDGTLTLQNGRLDIGSTGVLTVQDDGLLDVNGTGDNVIEGTLNIYGVFETSGDIDISGGSVTVDSQGEILSAGSDIDLDVYNGGSFTLEDGGTATFSGDINNTDSDGCTLPACTPGGAFDISGDLIVGDDVTIDATTPASSFTSLGDTGNLQIGGTFNDNVCANYDETDYTFCECNGQSNITSCSAVLPIELISFSGRQRGKMIVLDWSTASELNNDYFTVEKLTEEDIFTSILELNGSGTSHQEKKYQCFDLNPKPGKNYYRIKQTDFDNSSYYSSIIKVEFETLENLVSIYPNPCTEGLLSLHVEGLELEKSYPLNLKNALGITVIHKVCVSNNHGQLTEKIDVSMLPSGFYFLFTNHSTTKIMIRNNGN